MFFKEKALFAEATEPTLWSLCLNVGIGLRPLLNGDMPKFIQVLGGNQVEGLGILQQDLEGPQEP